MKEAIKHYCMGTVILNFPVLLNWWPYVHCGSIFSSKNRGILVCTCATAIM
jgi:hypothetical protein